VATALTSSFNWALSFVLTKAFLDMQRGMTVAGAYWFFGACCTAGGVFIAVAVPETKNVTYDQIQALLGNDVEHEATADAKKAP